MSKSQCKKKSEKMHKEKTVISIEKHRLSLFLLGFIWYFQNLVICVCLEKCLMRSRGERFPATTTK